MTNRITADFNVQTGTVRRELYCSGLHPFISTRHIDDFFDAFKDLRFYMVRNHDWAHNNTDQRLIDVHHIFPLMHLDPSDERNYYFAPSDEAIRLTYEAGSKVFYRLGTSIEHTEGIHFNTNPPEDFDKYAEVCAAIVRHYTKGWNNGFHYDMPYWEIWNEPDLKNGAMWTGSAEQFALFFAIVLKRLKTEFPELKVGGPAHTVFSPCLIDMIKAECDKLDVTPDFYSYHIYSNNLDAMRSVATEPRKYLDKIGWNKTESILNEWHFIRSWVGVHSNLTEESYNYSINSRDGLMGINSAAFNVASFCIFQNSPLDYSFYYGCGTGNWGVYRPSRLPNKNFYSLIMMRDMVYDFPKKTTVSGCDEQTQCAIAGLSEDGSKAAMLLGDLYGISTDIPVEIKGFDFKKATCIALDDIRDNVPIPLQPDNDGILHLMKNEPGSAAFMLILEK